MLRCDVAMLRCDVAVLRYYDAGDVAMLRCDVAMLRRNIAISHRNMAPSRLRNAMVLLGHHKNGRAGRLQGSVLAPALFVQLRKWFAPAVKQLKKNDRD